MLRPGFFFYASQSENNTLEVSSGFQIVPGLSLQNPSVCMKWCELHFFANLLQTGVCWLQTATWIWMTLTIPTSSPPTHQLTPVMRSPLTVRRSGRLCCTGLERHLL